MKKYFALQLAALAAGTIFAWYTVYQDFHRFYTIEGTVFKVRDCLVPNPVTTACFWGSIAFAIALVWAWKNARKSAASGANSVVRSQRFLLLFLIAGNLFAWSNALLGVIRFYKNQGLPTIGCSGQLVTDPFTTPCFIGSVLFLVALLTAVLVVMNLNAHQKVTKSAAG